MRRLLIGLTIAGAALRFATLDVQSFWYDEAVTVGLVHLDFGSMLDHIPNSESTPPLYYVLAWLWTQLFGSGEVGIRSLSALFGTAAIPVFYLAARELARSERAGVAVAALAAFNPLLVWYSQEARTYALLTLLGALSLYFFARLLSGVETRWLVWWAVTSGLALTAHYFAGFLVVPEAAWLLWRTPTPAGDRRCVGRDRRHRPRAAPARDPPAAARPRLVHPEHRPALSTAAIGQAVPDRLRGAARDAWSRSSPA